MSSLRLRMRQPSALLFLEFLGDWSLRSPKPSSLFAAPQAVALFASQLYFRGQRIWLAGMEKLMAQGMHSAEQVFINCGYHVPVIDVSGNRTMRNLYAGVVKLGGAQKNALQFVRDQLDPTLVTLLASWTTHFFARYRNMESLAPRAADPNNDWRRDGAHARRRRMRGVDGAPEQGDAGAKEGATTLEARISGDGSGGRSSDGSKLEEEKQRRAAM
ncbi:hypothetical protein Syun_019543 [Stephania yunnanensis]|uniref:Uncharacterized protein n=1 Tax=Stephania yunnanensis TaxID=152371 RepID=A0AAP0IUB4_9MAGN